MRKTLRVKIWNKYKQRCSYCGKHLLYHDMQVDHFIPLRSINRPPEYLDAEEINGFDNLMPSCRRCNHYKRGYSLSEFRRLISTIHNRIADDYITKVAIDYGIVKFWKWDNMFYFEKFKQNATKKAAQVES